MSVLGTCHGILKLYQSVNMYFTVKKKKERKKIAFTSRTPRWRDGWGGLQVSGAPDRGGAMPLPPQGMGGQHNYFGLWIDVDFGKGHSKAKPTCTTYNSPQLSAQEDFRFEKMEVWAVGDASVTQLVSMGAFLPFLGFVPFTPPSGDGLFQFVSSSRCWPEGCQWVHSRAEDAVWGLWRFIRKNRPREVGSRGGGDLSAR